MKLNGAGNPDVEHETRAVRSMPKRNPLADANATRRKILIGGAGVAAAISLPTAASGDVVMRRRFSFPSAIGTSKGA